MMGAQKHAEERGFSRDLILFSQELNYFDVLLR